MLSEERNRTLTEVGPGTQMGALLRRYWQPIAAVAELDDAATKPVRLLGEDLVLYKDLSGTLRIAGTALSASQRRSVAMASSSSAACAATTTAGCSTRPAPASSSRSRTSLHRRSRFRDQVRIRPIRSRRRRVCCGRISDRTPRRWCRTGSRSAGTTGSCRSCSPTVPCNWFQCQENSIDPVHFEWMHDNWGRRLAGHNGPYAPRHLKLAFDEFEYGLDVSPGARGFGRDEPAMDDRPRLPVAERAVHRQSLRVARADRRHQHAERRLVLHPRAEGSRTVRAGQHSVLARADHRRRRPAAGSPATS